MRHLGVLPGADENCSAGPQHDCGLSGITTARRRWAGPLDEILKDADVIDHSLSDPTKEVKAHEIARYTKLCEELGLAE